MSVALLRTAPSLAQQSTPAVKKPDRFLPSYFMLSEEKDCAGCSGKIGKNKWACCKLDAEERYHRDCFVCDHCNITDLYKATERWGIKRLDPVYITEVTSGKPLLYCSERCRDAGKPPMCDKLHCNRRIELPGRLVPQFGERSFHPISPEHPSCFACVLAKPGEVCYNWSPTGHYVEPTVNGRVRFFNEDIGGLVCKHHWKELGHGKEFEMEPPLEYQTESIAIGVTLFSGFCQVHSATVPGIDYEVALRRPKDEKTGQRVLDKYNAELKMWYYLSSKQARERVDYILPLIRTIKYVGHIWAMSRWMNKGTLLKYAGKDTTQGLDKLKLLRHAAYALDWFHQSSVCHGDIHGDNFLVTDDGEKAVLADFGNSKFVGQFTSDGSKAVGVPLFKAPERLEGGPKTAEGDIYAFGTMIAQILLSLETWVAWCQRRSNSTRQGSMGTETGAFNQIYQKAMEAAEKCCANESSRRPPLSEVIRLLDENIAYLGTIPTLSQDVAMEL